MKKGFKNIIVTKGEQHVKVIKGVKYNITLASAPSP